VGCPGLLSTNIDLFSNCFHSLVLFLLGKWFIAMKMTKMTLTLCLVLLLWALNGGVAAQVYRYMDKNGVAHFTDTPTDKRFAPLHGAWIENNADREATGAEENKEEIARKEENGNQQPLVLPQGDFAVQLVDDLNIGQPQNEAQAQNMLSAIGIEPINGWAAGQPVTALIIVEIEKKVARAADAGKLRVGKDQALKAVRHIRAKYGQRLLKQTPGSGTFSSNPSPVKVITGKPTPSLPPNDSMKSSSPYKPYQSPTSSQSSVGKVPPKAPIVSSHPDDSVRYPSTRRPYQPHGSYPRMTPSEPKAVNPGAPRVPPRSDGSVKPPSTRDFDRR